MSRKPRLRMLKPRVQTLAVGRVQMLPKPSRQPGYRTRGRELQRIREKHFAAHPLCVACEAKGITRAATELDHIVPLFLGGTDTDDNRQGLCADCHKAKTSADMTGGVV